MPAKLGLAVFSNCDGLVCIEDCSKEGEARAS
jgi:hypothetical protein